METIFYRDRVKYIQQEVMTIEGVTLVEYPYLLSDHKAEKRQQMSDGCRSAIVSGIDATLSDGAEVHFSLEETDQLNLASAINAIQNGASEYPYHADGELCKMYSAADIALINSAATQHKLEQTIYCHLMMAWVERAETHEELERIVYGAELPEDLASDMSTLMTSAAAL